MIKNTDTICHSGTKEEGRPGSGEFGENLGEKLPIGGLGWGEERILFFSPSTRRTSHSSRRKPGGGGGSEMIATSCYPGLLPCCLTLRLSDSFFVVASSQANFNRSKAPSCVSSNFPGIKKRIYVRANKMTTLHSNPGQDCRWLMPKSLITHFKQMSFSL